MPFQDRTTLKENAIKYFFIDYKTGDKSFVSNPHSHQHYEIFYFEKGNASHFIDFEEYKIKDNSFFTTKQSDKFGEIISPDYKQHNPMVKQGLAGIQEGSKWFEAIFPDISANIDAVVVEGDIIVARITWTGTHKGELFGVPASNVKATWTGTDWWHIENGKLTEHWDVVDWSSLMQQIQAKN